MEARSHRFGHALTRAATGLLLAVALVASPRGLRADGDDRDNSAWRDGQHVDLVITEPVTVYRYSGGSSLSLGSWFTVDRMSSRDAARELLALPEGNTAEQYQEVTLQPGTHVSVGLAAELHGHAGGGYQIRVTDHDWATSKTLEWGAMHDTPSESRGPFSPTPSSSWNDVQQRASSLAVGGDAPWAQYRATADPRPGGVAMDRAIPFDDADAAGITSVRYQDGRFVLNGGAAFDPGCSEEEIVTVFGAVFDPDSTHRIVVDCTDFPSCSFEGPVGDEPAYVARLLMGADIFLPGLVEGWTLSGDYVQRLITSPVPSYHNPFEQRMQRYRDRDPALATFHAAYQSVGTHYTFSIGADARFAVDGNQVVGRGQLVDLWRECSVQLWDNTWRHGVSCDDRPDEAAMARDLVERFDDYADAHPQAQAMRRFFRLYGFLRWIRDRGVAFDAPDLHRRWRALGQRRQRGRLRFAADAASAIDRHLADDALRERLGFLRATVDGHVVAAARPGYERARLAMALRSGEGIAGWSTAPPPAGALEGTSADVTAGRWHAARAAALLGAGGRDLPPALGFVAQLAAGAAAAEAQHAAVRFRRAEAWRELAAVYRLEISVAAAGGGAPAAAQILNAYREPAGLEGLDSPVFQGPTGTFARAYFEALQRTDPTRAKRGLLRWVESLIASHAGVARMCGESANCAAAPAMRAAVLDAAAEFYAFISGGESARERFDEVARARTGEHPAELLFVLYNDALERRLRTRHPNVVALELTLMVEIAEGLVEASSGELARQWQACAETARAELCSNAKLGGHGRTPLLFTGNGAELVGRHARRACARRG